MNWVELQNISVPQDMNVEKFFKEPSCREFFWPEGPFEISESERLFYSGATQSRFLMCFHKTKEFFDSTIRNDRVGIERE
jgi:hypothetical protein